MPFAVFFNGTYPVKFYPIGHRRMWEVVNVAEATHFEDKDKAHEMARACDVRCYSVDHIEERKP